MGSMTRKSYRAYDEIIAGDIVQLGNHPRRVTSVRRDDRDRLRWMSVNRLRCGWATYSDGTKLGPWCDDDVSLYHTDLLGGTYEFKGWLKRAGEDETP